MGKFKIIEYQVDKPGKHLLKTCAYFSQRKAFYVITALLCHSVTLSLPYQKVIDGFLTKLSRNICCEGNHQNIKKLILPHPPSPTQ